MLTNGKSPFGELLNMTGGFPIEHDNRVWKSSEALYQAARFPDDHDIQEDIRNASNGFTAKLIAKKHAAETRDGWIDKQINVRAMAQVLRLKFDQHEAIRKVLYQTGDLPIVEQSKRDSFWGAKREGDLLVGQNMLGSLWMILRNVEGAFDSTLMLPGASLDAFRT